MRASLQPSEKNRITQLFYRGYNVTEIGKRVGRHTTTVANYLEESGARKKPKMTHNEEPWPKGLAKYPNAFEPEWYARNNKEFCKAVARVYKPVSAA